MSNEWKTLDQILPEMGRAAEADPENWRKNFEYKSRSSGGFCVLSQTTQLSDYFEYRRKPRLMEYTVRRLEPLLKHPENRQRYWVPSVSWPDWCFSSAWLGCDVDELRFNRGLCYATEEDAVAAAKAMVGEVEL